MQSENPAILRFTTHDSFPFHIGISYILDSELKIIDYTKVPWDSFAQENDGAKLVNERNVLGTSILDHIYGEAKAHYEKLFKSVIQKKKNKVMIPFNCDSAESVRDCLLLISYIQLNTKTSGVLCQSLVLKETLRPKIELFESQAQKTITNISKQDENLKLVHVCSYCKKVKDESSQKWISAEEYYRKGGIGNVKISHGACEECTMRIMAEFDSEA
jgi:hypothetical protein